MAVIHLTNWSSRSLHHGTAYTIMRRPNPAHGQIGAGRVEALTPDSMVFDALKAGRLSGAEYRRRFELDMEYRVLAGVLAPGRLGWWRSEAGGQLSGLVHDGDTLCCGCSRTAAAEGNCHRVWSAAALIRAGWSVVLDGVALGAQRSLL